MANAQPGSLASGSSELEDARWFTREQIIAGAATLPPPTSISHRLIEHWFDELAPMRLRDLPVNHWSTTTRH